MLTMDGPSGVFPLSLPDVCAGGILGAVFPLPTRSQMLAPTIKERIANRKCETGARGAQFHKIIAPGMTFALRNRK